MIELSRVTLNPALGDPKFCGTCNLPFGGVAYVVKVNGRFVCEDCATAINRGDYQLSSDGSRLEARTLTVVCSACNMNHTYPASDAERIIYAFQAAETDDDIETRDEATMPDCLNSVLAMATDGEGFGEHTEALMEARIRTEEGRSSTDVFTDLAQAAQHRYAIRRIALAEGRCVTGATVLGVTSAGYASLVADGIRLEQGIQKVLALLPEQNPDDAAELRAFVMRLAADGQEITTDVVLLEVYKALASGIPADSVFQYVEVKL
jgi:hypothetical protein